MVYFNGGDLRVGSLLKFENPEQHARNNILMQFQ